MPDTRDLIPGHEYLVPPEDVGAGIPDRLIPDVEEVTFLERVARS